MKAIERQEPLEISYPTDASLLVSRCFPSGSCVHLLCTTGHGSLVYGERNFEFRKNDVVIISRTDLLDDFRSDKDFTMECLTAPLKFLYNQLPANHYGIGGCISLWDNPVISLTDEDAKLISEDFRRLKERIGQTGKVFYSFGTERRYRVRTDKPAFRRTYETA